MCYLFTIFCNLSFPTASRGKNTMPKPARFMQSFHGLWRTDGQTPDDSKCRASMWSVYQTLYEALNPLTLSKDYLNPFYFQCHTLAFHSQLLHVLPLPRINLCNALL